MANESAFAVLQKREGSW